MELFETIQNRMSYRGSYQPAPVPREHLQKIMEAALAAPSGCNQQTTSLIGVDDPALLKTLGGMLKKPGFATAPAAIVVLTERIVSYHGNTYFKQDYAAAIENALLAVTALGYASCWVEGYVSSADGVGGQMAEILHVPEPLEVVAYLPVGLPADAGVRAQKKPFEQRAWFNGYPQNKA